MKRTLTSLASAAQKFSSAIFYSLIAFIQLLAVNSHAQTIPVSICSLEESLRRMQLNGTIAPSHSFMIRPLFNSGELSLDSLQSADSTVQWRGSTGLHYLKGKGFVRLLPVTLSQQVATNHPYGWNDGAVIPSRGYQNYLRLGAYTRIGPLSIQLQPELVYAQNKNFPTFPSSHSDSIWRSYYYVLNRIDMPEQFGNRRYLKLFPGQSSVRLNFRKLSFGVSTENLWWGPGMRNALIMSNTAPGFKHLTFNTTSPVRSAIGSFEWQLISGILENSEIIPPDTTRRFEYTTLYVPKINDKRYINGLVLTWQPKWTKGLYLGFARAFHQYKSKVPASLNGYLPVFSMFFKKNVVDDVEIGRDQLASIFARLVMPESRMELYAEYGRNDHSQDLTDLLLEPEHTRAYILGLRRLFSLKKKTDLEFFMEITHLQNPPTKNLRALEGWYTHYQVRHGYTHLGQVLGAGIGPGGSSQTTGLNWINSNRKFGMMIERVVHNNDFYYDAFEPQRNFSSHWVDLSLNLNSQWIQKRFTYSADITLIRSLNYEWQYQIDRNNLFARFVISYAL